MAIRHATDGAVLSHLLETINRVDHVDISGKTAPVKVDAVMPDRQISRTSGQGFIVKVTVTEFKTIPAFAIKCGSCDNGHLSKLQRFWFIEAGLLELR